MCSKLRFVRVFKLELLESPVTFLGKSIQNHADFPRGKISAAGGWILRKITGEMICHNFLLMTEDMKDHHNPGGGLMWFETICFFK